MRRRWSWGRVFRWIGLVAAVGFLIIQLVPYGRNHTNPPVTQDAAWPSATVRNLAIASCYDCHSNETRWPWYSNVAPMSWLIQHDVDEGRSVLNFSEMDRPQREAEEAADTVRDGEMPPWAFTLLHPDAELTDAEKANLAVALSSMFRDT